MHRPLVSIICPTLNSAQYLRHTIESIVEQTYENVEIIIVDGGSTDETESLVKSFGNSISQFVSEADNGIYDALSKGFAIATGEIVCYINAGDFFNPYAISVAVQIFEASEATWITGFRSVCNEKGEVNRVELPFRYRNDLLMVGSYGKSLPFIQQETTLWRRELLDLVDFDYFRKLKLAGDYYLWWSFAHRHRLEVVACPFGVFKQHKGQLSEDRTSYIEEMERFCDKRTLMHRLKEWSELIFWSFHPYIRAYFFDHVYCYHNEADRWKRGQPRYKR